MLKEIKISQLFICLVFVNRLFFWERNLEGGKDIFSLSPSLLSLSLSLPPSLPSPSFPSSFPLFSLSPSFLSFFLPLSLLLSLPSPSFSPFLPPSLLPSSFPPLSSLSFKVLLQFPI
jgi:hypothetical protein